MPGRPHRHRLRRRNQARSARRARRSLSSREQLRGSVPDGAIGGNARGRLRAGLGDRHRPDPDARPTWRRSTRYPRGAGRLVGRPSRRRVRILYGGSVKPSNAAELMARAERGRRARRRREPRRRRISSASRRPTSGWAQAVTLRPSRLRDMTRRRRPYAIDRLDQSGAACHAADAWLGRLRSFGPMQTVLIVIHLIIVLALIGVVLLQRSEGGGSASAAAAACRLHDRPRPGERADPRDRDPGRPVLPDQPRALDHGELRPRRRRSIFDGARRPRRRPAGSGGPASGGQAGVLDQLQRLQGGQPAAPRRRALRRRPPTAPSGPQVPQFNERTAGPDRPALCFCGWQSERGRFRLCESARLIDGFGGPMTRYVFITGGVVSSLGKGWLRPPSARSCRRAATRSACASSTPTSTSIRAR